jgi:hypothetical protein
VNKLQLLHWLFEEEEQGCFFGILHKNEKYFCEKGRKFLTKGFHFAIILSCVGFAENSEKA